MGMEVGGTKNVKSDINVVPLIDVVLVLLVIFMVVTPMLQKGVDVILPKAKYAEKKEGVKITLTIKRDGQMFLDMDRVPKTRLEDKLTSVFENREDKTMYIKADQTLTFDKIMEVMDICTKAGVKEIGLMTEKTAEE
ncbi:MAG: biopolymer transporter ExbD [Candidatus Schekmanbacteria bacterium]|nr:MAG: biopolymer transporter ExbD [Candidatus Schekmanbacteria bacterium]